MSWILVSILVLLLVWAVVLYNLLVRDSKRVEAAWSDIDVQLKRRHDLIPKLVEATRAYAGYEKQLMQELAGLRVEALQPHAPGELGRIEGGLGNKLHSLLAVAEAYPELKANEQFLHLQQQLSEVEEKIQYARRYYNGTVRNLNVRIDAFPSLILARLFRFRPAEFFELDGEGEGEPPSVT